MGEDVNAALAREIERIHALDRMNNRVLAAMVAGSSFLFVVIVIAAVIKAM